MIYVEVTGPNEEWNTHLKETCYLFLRELNIFKRTIPLDININLVKLKAHGYCEFNADFLCPEITISIKKTINEKEMILTLAHELVHARQYLRKQLRIDGREKYWMGVLSENEEWETEAYAFEQKLYGTYLKWK